jgi:DNA-binding MarR family transcriptional regulator
VNDPRDTDDATRPDPIDWSAEGIETELGWSLQAMYQGFTRTASVAVSTVPGGPRGYQVLVAITTEQPDSQLALAKRLGIDKTAMTYVVDALENAGLVERRLDPRDRRARQVVPTRPGRAALGEARAALRTVEGSLMGELSAAEQQQLRRLLARAALGIGHDDASPTTGLLEQPVAAPHRSRRHPEATEQN